MDGAGSKMPAPLCATHKTMPIHEAIKPIATSEIEKSSQIFLSQQEVMDVGGYEGEKQRVRVAVISKSEERTRDAGMYVTKTPVSNGIDNLHLLAESYQFLRKKGYPVPRTARYMLNKSNMYKSSLLLSDMTENGAYQIWGYNDDVEDRHYQALRDMKLSDEDMSEIRKLSYALARKADDDNILLFFHYYHVKKNATTGKIDICLLDVDKDMYPAVGNMFGTTNFDEVIEFFDHINKYR